MLGGNKHTWRAALSICRPFTLQRRALSCFRDSWCGRLLRSFIIFSSKIFSSCAFFTGNHTSASPSVSNRLYLPASTGSYALCLLTVTQMSVNWSVTLFTVSCGYWLKPSNKWGGVGRKFPCSRLKWMASYGNTQIKASLPSVASRPWLSLYLESFY